ncbi:MAG TPA: glycine C-acetyltransferase [Planctomycetota bacterium]|jgi:glycine C-acetyltransferase|nr:glycine C-acetyltransferase [Planctomycetota bacterium]
MIGATRDRLAREIEGIREAGTFKEERLLEGPQGARIRVGGREVLNFCANNYLGLANDRRLVQAAQGALGRFGFGLSSVRFICGTQTIHKDLERRIASFLKTEDAILYTSCFDANGGLFETLLGEEDAVISDALNHASIIDGIRLCKAERLRYAHADMGDLERRLKEARAKRTRLIATDGVFSMDGDVARLADICALAEAHDALVMLDDSHATGFFGPTGRGTPEHCGVEGRVDVITSTLGKALGGASGGFTAGRREIVELLRQRSRPYLFSNTLPPALVAAGIAVLDLLSSTTELRDRLEKNTAQFRGRIAGAGFKIREGIHPIVPILLGDAKLAGAMARDLLEEGIYVIGFSYPVVPKGEARIRVQISAAHDREQIDRCVEAFRKVGSKHGVVR